MQLPSMFPSQAVEPPSQAVEPPCTLAYQGAAVSHLAARRVALRTDLRDLRSAMTELAGSGQQVVRTLADARS